ncbi:MAG TPA: GIY-YIG nuclease family protein [Anditalea sp.]|nr:GIY-YIG nuclease family protein [Anditalea sp.]
METIYVYAIKNLARSYIYVGMSNNVERRLKQHNNGENRSTKPYAPFVLILVEEYPSRSAARQREKFLNAGSGKKYLKSL